MGYLYLLKNAVLTNSTVAPDQIAKLTQAIQQQVPSWSQGQTVKLLEEASRGGQSSILISSDTGAVRIEVIGDTVLLNGKDITGNLGSKTTYGNQSPIIENSTNSNIIVGDKNSVTQQKKSSYRFSITTSLALTVSLGVTAYYLYQRRKRKIAQRK